MVIFVITEPKRTPFGIVSECVSSLQTLNDQSFFVHPTLLIEPLALHPLNVLEVLHRVSGLERGSQSLQKFPHHHLVLVQSS